MQFCGTHQLLRLVSVDVDDRRCDLLGEIRAVTRTSSSRTRRSEPNLYSMLYFCAKLQRSAYLIVNHEVNGAANAVVREVGHLQRLLVHALSRQSRVPVHLAIKNYLFKYVGKLPQCNLHTEGRVAHPARSILARAGRQVLGPDRPRRRYFS